MDQPKKISGEQLPALDEPGRTGARRRAWRTPELIRMDLVDSTRDGDVDRTHAEDVFYRLIS
jgi:hypothetical protein